MAVPSIAASSRVNGLRAPCSIIRAVEFPPLEYRTTRARMAMYALVALMFVALGLWMAFDGGASPMAHFWGWLGVAFGGFCFVMSVRETVSPRIGLRLDSEGIHSRQALAANTFDLPWSELAAVRVANMNGQPMVVFEAHTPDWGADGARPGVRRMRAANDALVGSWMVIAPRVFGATAEGIVADVDRYRRYYIPDMPVEYPRPGHEGLPS
jgi:hypothetical protein